MATETTVSGIMAYLENAFNVELLGDNNNTSVSADQAVVIVPTRSGKAGRRAAIAGNAISAPASSGETSAVIPTVFIAPERKFTSKVSESEKAFVEAVLRKPVGQYQSEIAAFSVALQARIKDKSAKGKASRAEMQARVLIGKIHDRVNDGKKISPVEIRALQSTLSLFGIKYSTDSSLKIPASGSQEYANKLSIAEINMLNISREKKRVLLGLVGGAAVGVGAAFLVSANPELTGLKSLNQIFRVITSLYGTLPSFIAAVDYAWGKLGWNETRTGTFFFRLSNYLTRIQNFGKHRNMGSLLGAIATGYSLGSVGGGFLLGEFAHHQQDTAEQAEENSGVDVVPTPEALATPITLQGGTTLGEFMATHPDPTHITVAENGTHLFFSDSQTHEVVHLYIQPGIPQELVELPNGQTVWVDLFDDIRASQFDPALLVNAFTERVDEITAQGNLHAVVNSAPGEGFLLQDSSATTEIEIAPFSSSPEHFLVTAGDTSVNLSSQQVIALFGHVVDENGVQMFSVDADGSLVLHQPEPTETPSVTPSSTPSSTPTVTSTPTATLTPKPAPTETPTPTLTPTTVPKEIYVQDGVTVESYIQSHQTPDQVFETADGGLDLVYFKDSDVQSQELFRIHLMPDGQEMEKVIFPGGEWEQVELFDKQDFDIFHTDLEPAVENSATETKDSGETVSLTPDTIMLTNSDGEETISLQDFVDQVERPDLISIDSQGEITLVFSDAQLSIEPNIGSDGHELVHIYDATGETLDYQVELGDHVNILENQAITQVSQLSRFMSSITGDIGGLVPNLDEANNDFDLLTPNGLPVLQIHHSDSGQFQLIYNIDAVIQEFPEIGSDFDNFPNVEMVVSADTLADVLSPEVGARLPVELVDGTLTIPVSGLPEGEEAVTGTNVDETTQPGDDFPKHVEGRIGEQSAAASAQADFFTKLTVDPDTHLGTAQVDGQEMNILEINHGDTLWDIARSIQKGDIAIADKSHEGLTTNQLIAQIQAANADNPDLQDGLHGKDILIIPNHFEATPAAASAQAVITPDQQTQIVAGETIWAHSEAALERYEQDNGVVQRPNGVTDFLKDAHLATFGPNSESSFSPEQQDRLIAFADRVLTENTSDVTSSGPTTEQLEQFQHLGDTEKLVVALNLDGMNGDTSWNDLSPGDKAAILRIANGEITLDSSQAQQTIVDSSLIKKLEELQ